MCKATCISRIFYTVAYISICYKVVVAYGKFPPSSNSCLRNVSKPPTFEMYDFYDHTLNSSHPSILYDRLIFYVVRVQLSMPQNITCCPNSEMASADRDTLRFMGCSSAHTTRAIYFWASLSHADQPTPSTSLPHPFKKDKK